MLLAGILCSSCTEYIRIDRDPLEDKLDILALMHSSDTEHFVYVKVSNDHGLTSAEEDAVVTCTINDGAPIHAGWCKSGEMGKFSFEAGFMPGDRVRIDARYNGMHAWSEVVVPQPVDIELIDTAKRIEYEDNEKKTDVFVNIRIRDIKGEESHYRVGDMRHELRHIFHQWPEEDGTPRPDEERVFVRTDNSKTEIGSDPVLNDDYMMDTGGNDYVAWMNPTNFYRIFTDKHFADDAAEVQVTFGEHDLETFYSLYFGLPEHLKETEVFSTAHIVIEHITPAAYRYYKALNVARTDQFHSYGGLIMEPVTIPCNVEGGIGFVNISMDSWVSVPVHHSMMEGFDGETMVPME